MNKGIADNPVPIVSVVMSVYKEPMEWMRQSIDSILNQTLRNFEFIIVNDNPDRKENEELLNEYSVKDARIVLISNEQNIGLTKSLNKGIATAKGKYIARMDADDISLPERFQRQVRFLDEHSDIGVCGSNVRCFGKFSKIRKYPEHHEEIFLFIESCFAHPAVMARTDLMRQFLYNENCRYAQDYELWFRMSQKGVIFYNIQEVLLNYRTSAQQIGANFTNSQNKVGKYIRRVLLESFIHKQSKSFKFSNDNINLEDIEKICNCVTLPENAYQKLLFYLILSVNDKFDRIRLLFQSIFKYHMNYNYYLHLLYFYLKGKRIELF